MNVKTSLLGLALGVALSGAASAASMSAGEAESLSSAAGLTDISTLEFCNDVWLATARNGEGELVDGRVDLDDREVT